MRKIKLFASILLVVSLLSSCSILPLGRNEQLKSQAQIEHEAMEQFEDIFLEALKDMDSDKIIDCFSEQSRQRTDDFDEGCEYIFELYNGNDNPEVIEDNVSSYTAINRYDRRMRCGYFLYSLFSGAFARNYEKFYGSYGIYAT